MIGGVSAAASAAKGSADKAATLEFLPGGDAEIAASNVYPLHDVGSVVVVCSPGVSVSDLHPHAITQRQAERSGGRAFERGL